jgi:hypothetical protein
MTQEERLFDRASSLGGYRTYKNNVLFLAADKEQVDNMVEVAQRYLAIGRIVGDPSRMQEFNEEQRKRPRLSRVCWTNARTRRWSGWPGWPVPDDPRGLYHAQLWADGGRC